MDGTAGAPALEMRGISKRFGAIQALHGVDLRVRAGTVHALLGENGAGKSTLMHVAFGILHPDAGSVHPARGARRGAGEPRPGVGMVHQHLSLVPAMSALENFELGAGGPGRLDLGRARRRLEALGDASGLRVPADLPVRDMSIVQQQRLEILKALGRDASLIIMDEPTAVLAPAEVRDLLEWVRGFAARGGSVVLVTHKLREALAVADDITVLRRGEVVWSGVAAGTSEAQLADAIFPGGGTALGAATAPATGATCVRARNLALVTARRSSAIADATFDIARGEIVGIAAVEGSGQRELLAALAGLQSPGAGELELPPAIAFIPGDRNRDAIIPAFTLTENVALRGLGARRGAMPWTAIRAATEELVARFSIAAPAADSPAGALSGGNQQRLVVARELAGNVDLVVAENPTRGLDLHATSFVHEQLRAAADRGAAVVVHSSDLDEVLALSTRVLVVFHGRVTEVAADRDAVGRAMLGAA